MARFTLHLRASTGAMDYKTVVEQSDDVRALSERARSLAQARDTRAELIDVQLNKVIFRAEGSEFRWITR
jgi:hypothetical protein